MYQAKSGVVSFVGVGVEGGGEVSKKLKVAQNGLKHSWNF